MTRLWYIDGQYQSYDYLHNHEGYTLSASVEVGYKSGANGSWGADTSVTGYHFANGLSDEFFASGHVGWYSFDELVSECELLPENAETFLVTNGSIISNAASSAVSPALILYYVQAAPELGWMTYEEMEEEGWREAVEEPMPYAGNFTLNETIESDTVDGGFGILNKSYSKPIVSLEGWSSGGFEPNALSGRWVIDLIGWSAGSNLNLAFFTSLGALATSDFTIPDDDTGPLYNADGNPISYFDSSIQYEVKCAWRSDGSVWTASELAYISSLYEDDTPPTLHWASDYNIIDNPTILCLMYQMAIPTTLEVVLGVRWSGSNWIAPSFTTNDWFYSGIRNYNDLALIQALGLSTTTAAGNAGPLGNIVYSSVYEYEILELYADADGTTPSQYTDMTNLYMDAYSYSGANLLVIRNTNAISSGLIMSYKLRITKKTT